MTPTISLARPSPVPRALGDALLAGALSTAALMWRGRSETRSAVAPLNAISHWFWPTEALRRDDPSLKYTGTGTAVHYASSVLWSSVYGWLRWRRLRPTVANAIGDAAAVTAVAALVDLKVVPKRLSPGFEERLSTPSLFVVYAGFAAGLALGGVMALRR